jgi:hypothetical protein
MHTMNARAIQHTRRDASGRAMFAILIADGEFATCGDATVWYHAPNADAALRAHERESLRAFAESVAREHARQTAAN